jgi:prepilin-type N-terminal cleavage/methylation domain-containing protein
MMKRSTAFTLIELLIVVLIIAILAAIAIPNFMEFQTRAKVSRVHSDMRTIAVGLEAYCVDWGDYPGHSDESMLHDLAQYNLGHGLCRLTTPIAFLTSIPYDPFHSQQNVGGGDMAHLGNIVYGLNSNGCRNRIWELGCCLDSPGPDRLDDFAANNYPDDILYATEYDPTNGTASNGEIFRFLPGPYKERIVWR